MTKELTIPTVKTITTDEELSEASSLLGKVMGQIKYITALRAEEVKPLNEGLSKVRNRYKVALEPWEDAEKLIKEEIKKYHAAKEKEAYKEQEETGEVQVLPKATVRTEEGTVSIKKRWTYAIEDEALIPRKFWSVDPVKVNKAIRDGEREIGGLRIYQKEDVSFRK